nr:asparagine synthase (glutamine-hydrolyzing) [candidate division Zixibacteria bacterium]
MCGIAGYFQIDGRKEPDRELLVNMVTMIRHRGPDEFGAFFDDKAALGQARLSIIDLSTGSQPLANEDESIWITFNGEIFNYVELRPELEKRGHRFRTRSDTEVIVHAYEEWGRECVNRFNGQFAFAVYDRNRESLFIARDRLGIRPVFYTIHKGRFYFASEIKAIFADRKIPRKIDFKGLDEIFTWWTTCPPRTAFEDINELAAGCYLEIADGKVNGGRYWSMTFPEVFDKNRSIDSWAEELHALLVDSVRLRLRADVPVGGYLSGGLDSSATTALIKNFTPNRIETFSIAFKDKAYDESEYQNQMADFLGTNHNQIHCGYRDIADNFPRVIWHAERPIVRTAPTPLLMLSGLVRQNNFKVVLTGEGSDEILGGYDIFKEVLIRRFWARYPDSVYRPLLLRRLYPTLPLSPGKARFYLETFYKTGLSQVDDYYFSHIPRINTTSRIKGYYTDQVKDLVRDYDSVSVFGRDLPDGFKRWHHLSRAQYLEAKSLLSGYLLTSQGDRVCAANAVEGRFPFLDHRVVEFAAKIPPLFKIMGLKEKYVLKKAMQKELPRNIIERVKQPYMAPDSNSFVQNDSPEYIAEILSESSIKRVGIFNALAVNKLREKCGKLSHAHLSFKDNMSFIGILSTQLLWQLFIDDFRAPIGLTQKDFKVWHDNSMNR